MVLNPALVPVGASWVGSTMTLSTYANTAFLKAGNSALDLTVTRIVGAAFLGLLSEAILQRGVGAAFRLCARHARAFVFPAMCLYGANFFNSIALEQTGITLTYVTKCAVPVATALLCWCGLGATPRSRAYLALPPTVLGVALASWGNLEMKLTGVLAACASTFFQALMNVFVRSAIVSSRITGTQGNMLMCSLISLLLLPYHTASSLARTKAKAQVGTVQGLVPPRLLPAVTALAYHIEYSLQFAFASMVTPVTMAIADATRRVAVVMCGRLMFGGKPMSKQNVFGIALAISGALMYVLLNQAPKL